MQDEPKKRILVVEDDQPLADVLRLMLESKGFEVHTELRGTKALVYAADHPVHLAILDLKLPDLSGYEVCKQLRRIYHLWELPIVMLSALDEPLDQLRGFAHGADAYLTKPCESAELLKTINLLI